MGVVLVFGILITGLWSELDRLSPIVAVSLIIISVVAENLKASKKSKLNVRAGLQLIDGREVLLATLLSLPVFLSLLGKLQGEFPFSGDHDHHAAALLAGANYWKSAGWIVAAAIVLFSLVEKLAYRRWLGAGAILALWVLSTQYHAPDFYFSRYPAALYTIAAPILWLLDSFGVQSVLHAIEIANALSVPVYLLLLRPIFLRRKIDFSILLFVSAILINGQYLYYLSGSYLEPWAIVLVALAAELILSQSEERWRALYMIGLASLFKEQAILILPFAYLSIYRKKIFSKEAIIHGLVAVAPFCSYYAMRIQDQIWRKSDFSAFSEALSSHRLNEWAYRFYDQWGAVGGTIFVIGLILGFWLLWKSQLKWGYFILAAAGIFQIGFFYFDKVSFDWTGYPRFHLLAFVLLMSWIWNIDFSKWSTQAKRIALGSALACGASTGVVEILKSYGYFGGLSFYEHYDSPQYYPIQRAVEAGRSAGVNGSSQNLFIVSPTPQFHPQAIGLGYRELIKEFRFMAKGYAPELVCGCTYEQPNNLLLKLVVANLKLKSSWTDAVLNREKTCLQALKAHCEKVVEIENRQKEVIGYIATGVGQQ